MNNEWKKYAKDIFPEEFQKFESLNYTGSNSDTDVRLGVSIEDDVNRRDFTINALFYNIHDNEIIDLVDGIKDLRKGIIRAVGNPAQRFAEDNLRKLRAVRFASRLNFRIDIETLYAISADPSLNVTLERIYNEVATMYTTAKNIEFLTKLLYQSGLLSKIFPEVTFKDTGNYARITSFSSWIATIYKDYPTIAKMSLYHLKFPTVICNDVEFLLKYCVSDTVLIKHFHPVQFYKQWQACSLFPEDILNFGNHLPHLKFLVSFRPNPETTKKYQDQGFEGKQLGEQLNHHYKLKYLIAINHKNG